MSYFDALKRSQHGGGNAGDLDTDFQFFADANFDGIRIFPNWQAFSGCTQNYDTSRLLFNDDTEYAASLAASNTGTNLLRAGQWDVFTRVLDRASAKGLLVDVSFVRFGSGGAGLSRANYEAQLAIVVNALKNSYPNVLIDVQNEWPNNENAGGAGVSYITSLLANMAAIDGTRILTASMDNQNGVSQANAGGYAVTIGEGLVAYHDDRGPTTWYSSVGSVISDLKNGIGTPRRPIYLQEPMPTSERPSCSQLHDPNGANFETAAKAARSNGAAAWTLHTRLTFDLSSATYKSKVAPSGTCSATECTSLTTLRAATATQRWGFSFTDDPIQAPSTTSTPAATPIRAAHIMELRARLDALLDHFSLSPVSWTDSTLASGSTEMKASHVSQLRSAACSVYTHLSLTQPGFCGVTPSGVIYGSHIAELRAAVLTLEGYW